MRRSAGRREHDRPRCGRPNAPLRPNSTQTRVSRPLVATSAPIRARARRDRRRGRAADRRRGRRAEHDVRAARRPGRARGDEAARGTRRPASARRPSPTPRPRRAPSRRCGRRSTCRTRSSVPSSNHQLVERPTGSTVPVSDDRRTGELRGARDRERAGARREGPRPTGGRAGVASSRRPGSGSASPAGARRSPRRRSRACPEAGVRRPAVRLPSAALVPYSNHATVPRPRGSTEPLHARGRDRELVRAAGRDRGAGSVRNDRSAPRRCRGRSTRRGGSGTSRPRVRPSSRGRRRRRLRRRRRPSGCPSASRSSSTCRTRSTSRSSARSGPPCRRASRPSGRAPRRGRDDLGRAAGREHGVGAAARAAAVRGDDAVVVGDAGVEAGQLLGDVDGGGAVPRAPGRRARAVRGALAVLDVPARRLAAGVDATRDDCAARAHGRRRARDRGRGGRAKRRTHRGGRALRTVATANVMRVMGASLLPPR